MPRSSEPKTADELKIFAEALEKPGPAERKAYLDEIYGDNPALRSSVEELLKHHLEGSSFLHQPAVDLRASLSEGAPAAAEKPGSIIGSYTLVELVGEGGCGVVYKARQETPLRREVALKLIKPGMDTREVIARFDAERQALARLNHPYIAKVIEAGATSVGRPYFVMEWVPGKRITHYCDAERLSAESRIRLFIDVCHAIQHAHQKGIIHRDLKPSNILVCSGSTAEAGVPRVIDFGIAKATDDRLTELTLVTQAGHFLGTPAYMSPEQAAGGEGMVDTQSDIYSLGVILYEMLTGQTPLEARELLEAGPIRMRQIILEKDPLRPSTRLTTLAREEQTQAAQLRGMDVSSLHQRLKGDLDRVVMKALAKDKEQRYQTAQALADDLERFLKNLPVTAMPPSAVYRSKKFVRRNPLGVATAGVFAILVVVGAAMNVREARRATAAEQTARANERAALEAEQTALAKEKAASVAAQKSEQMARMMTAMLDGVSPSMAAGRDPRMLWDIFEKATLRLRTEKGLFPEVEAELQTLIGTATIEIGKASEAEGMFRAALAAEQRMHEEDHPRVLAAMSRLAGSLGMQKKNDENNQWRELILERTRRRHGADSMEVATALDFCGSARNHLRRYPEAIAFHQEALEIRKRHLPPDSLGLVQSYLYLANLQSAQQQEHEAELTYQRARKIYAANGEFVGEANCLDNLAGVLIKGGRLEEAETLRRESIELRIQHQGPTHPETANAHSHLAYLLLSQGQLEEAETHFRRCLDVRRQLYPETHKAIARAASGLAEVLAKKGKAVESEAPQREVPGSDGMER